MSLDKYRKKRAFDKTPEPVGGKPAGDQLRFVVQKHQASHLHYDFRLEMEGVLKSWAVPKGPSMDPEVKRLAMMVEDHPWDYRDFEGIIPEGYGAGTVVVWDEGTYEPVEKEKTKKENEKILLHHLYQGTISFVLHGRKLKGEFTLIKTADRGENAWLLIKNKDRYASDRDITEKNRSVLSGKTLEEVKSDPVREWQSNRVPQAGNSNKGLEEPWRKGEKKPFPKTVKPMLCSLIKEPFDDPGFSYEVKFDGYRIIAYIRDREVILRSRSGLDYSKKYPQVVKALSEMRLNVVVDGEVVALDENGRPDFDALQKSDRDNPVVFYLFDILWCEGYKLTNLPLTERKQVLSQVIGFNDVIRYSDDFEQGIQLFELISKQGMEGIVAKRKDSFYEPGKRGRDWLKLPTEKRQEFVIGGWTESENASPFAALIFGYYEKGKLIYQGHAGGGFKGNQKKKIKDQLKKIEIEKSPFANKVDTDRKAHFVKPELVANIKFATYTSSGKIRKPAIFLGFRKDKKAEQVFKEQPLQADEFVENHSEKTAIPASEWSVLEKEKITSEDSVIIDGKEVRLNNVEKELWPGVTKAQLIEYYHTMAPYLLPYLKDRPESLHIKNIRPTLPGLYIKDMQGRQPDWATVFSTKRKHPKQGKRKVIDYLVCNDEATLLYMINLGCVDVNPWNSRTGHYLEPDYIVIDLDPSDDDFTKVIRATLAAKKVFDDLKLKVFPKTSGKTGVHLYIPCQHFNFSQARTLAEKIADRVCLLEPDITTTEVTVSRRGNKLYIDPNQNDEADTVAAPYSVRPAPHPTVSTPLEWSEVNEKLDMQKFDIDTTLARVQKKGDLFSGVMDEKIRKKNTLLLAQLL